MWAAFAVLKDVSCRLPWLPPSCSPGSSPPPGHHDGRCWRRQGARVRWLRTPSSTGSPGAATSERHVRRSWSVCHAGYIPARIEGGGTTRPDAKRLNYASVCVLYALWSRFRSPFSIPIIVASKPLSVIILGWPRSIIHTQNLSARGVRAPVYAMRIHRWRGARLMGRIDSATTAWAERRAFPSRRFRGLRWKPPYHTGRARRL